MPPTVVFTVQCDSPYSPMYPHRIFIDGTVYRGGVAEYMQSVETTDLLEAMMHMFAQHIHLQKIFQDRSAPRVVHEPGPGVPRGIDATYEILAREFRRVEDVRTLFDPPDPERVDYVRRAQPACGLTRAIELSGLWARKKAQRIRYDVVVEDELALYDIRDPMMGYK